MRRTAAFQGRQVAFDEVTPDEALKLQQEGAAVVDVRNPDERATGYVTGSTHIPLPELPDRLAEVPEGRVLFICAKGLRSAAATELLEQAGRSDVSSIAEGTDGWTARGLPISR